MNSIPYIVCYLDKSGEQCSIHFQSFRRAEDFAHKYNGVIIHDGAIIKQAS
jgi:hypothetical protein